MCCCNDSKVILSADVIKSAYYTGSLSESRILLLIFATLDTSQVARKTLILSYKLKMYLCG